MKKITLLLLLLSFYYLNVNAQDPEKGLTEKDSIFTEIPIFTKQQALKLGHTFDMESTEITTHITSLMNTESDSETTYCYGVVDGTGIITFALQQPNVKATRYKTDRYILAGTKVNNIYYFTEYVIGSSGSIVPTKITSYNMSTNVFKNVATLPENSPIIMDMTYDYTTNKMYVIGAESSTRISSLYELNLSSGALTLIQEYSMRFYGLACDVQGYLYGADQSGILYSISKETGDLKKKENTGFKPGYVCSMDFDQHTNILYWAFCSLDGKASLLKINKTNANTVNLGTIGYAATCDEVVAFSIDSPRPIDSTPAAVDNFVLTPGANGALTARLDWINPSKTVGGEALSELTKIEIYQDNVLVKTIDSPEPGKADYADFSGLNNTYVTFKIIPYNQNGSGDFKEEYKWFGNDVPCRVENIKVERIDAQTSKITWDAPTSGKNDGYLSPTALKYRVTRVNVNTKDSVVLQKTYRKLELLDETVSDFSRYTYRIQALTHDYGDSNISAETLLGPAFSVPYSCQFTANEYSLWTRHDVDGNGTCWNNNPFGYVAYNPPSFPVADDWIITPPLELLKDSTYYVYFEYKSGYGELFPKKIQVTYGTTSDYRDHQVIKEYDFASRVVEQARIALPISETGEYYIGVRDISTWSSCNVSMYNFIVITKHTGWVTGQVTGDDDKPVEGVKVQIPNSNIIDYTDKEGKYKIDFIPTGDYPITFSKLGYYDISAPGLVSVVTDEETQLNIKISNKPTYSLSGIIKDVNGKTIKNTFIEISGYGDKIEIESDDEGKFKVDNLYENKYAINFWKYKHKIVKDSVDLIKDTDLEIIMEPSILAPSDFTTTLSDGIVTISWKAPLDIFRHDEGRFESQTGLLVGTDNTIHGCVFKQPAIIKNISWVTTSYKGPHNEMNLWILDITPEGKPTNKVLFNVMKAPSEGDEVWNKYELPYPVEAPNGYYLGVSYSYGMSSLAMDSGTDPDYPFVQYINYYSKDYTTNEWTLLDASFVKRNYLIRAEGDEVGENSHTFDYKYNVWRFSEDDTDDPENWTLLTSEPTSLYTISDDISSIAKGSYYYAIEAVYHDNKRSETAYSDLLNIADETGIAKFEDSIFKIYPNPVHDILYLSTACDYIKIYDSTGKLYISKEGVSMIDMTALEDGLYIAEIMIDNKISTQKVILKK